jgi:hypothetical protein
MGADARLEQDTAWVAEHLPVIPPAGWRLVTRSGSGDGAAYASVDGLAVILSGAVEADGKHWLHLSVSRRTYVPTWTDLRRVKETFLGDRYACIVFPPAAFYVNLSANVLHLWACVDGWPLPEFSGVVDGVRTV